MWNIPTNKFEKCAVLQFDSVEEMSRNCSCHWLVPLKYHNYSGKSNSVQLNKKRTFQTGCRVLMNPCCCSDDPKVPH